MPTKFVSKRLNSFNQKLDQLSADNMNRIEERIVLLAKNPTIGNRLKNSQLWTDRVGIYRILYYVDFKAREIEFYMIDKRSRVYKR